MNWLLYLTRRLIAALLCFGFAIVALLFQANLFYRLLFVNLGEAIIIWSVAYFIRTKSIYDDLFYNLGLFVNDSWPKFCGRNGSVYRFLLPIGLSTADFVANANAIQEYRGRSISVSYAFDSRINRGLVLIDETSNYGIRISSNISENFIVGLLIIFVILITDFYLK